MAGAALPAAAESPEFGPSVQDGTIGSNKDAGSLNECPADQALVGVRVEDRTNAPGDVAGGIINDFDLLCGTIEVNSPSAITVAQSPSYLDFPSYVNGDGVFHVATCPANMVVTQMGGHFFQGQGFPWASTIQISCQPLRFDAQGRIRVDTTATPVALLAGDNENLNAPAGFNGPFCGADDTQIVRGYRPQFGGEGYDGINVSCASLASDFGDAPAQYPAAGFEINGATFVGESVDAEPAEQPSADASADGVSDDGVTFPTIIGGVTPSAPVNVEVTNFAPVPATLTGWIDFDQDGVFEAGEQVTAPVAAGFTGPVVLTFGDVAARTTAAGGTTTARFTLVVNGVAGEVEDHQVIITPQAPALTIVKASTTTAASAAGQEIDYTFAVTNTGNVTISNIEITDAQLDAPAVCDDVVLDPGAATDCTGLHTVTQAEIDGGDVIENIATATGTPPGSTTPIPPTTSNPVIIPTVQTPALTIVKASTTTAASAAGQQIDYTLSATNTGNVTISNVAVSDAQLDTPAVCDEVVLAPGAVTECTGVHTVTQAEIEGGEIVNTATVTGTPPGSTTPIPPATSNPVIIPTAQTPALTIDKSASSSSVQQGATITYLFVARNTGNVTVSNVTITDPLPGLSALDCSTPAPVTLAVGETLTCTANYVTTAADGRAGSVLNTATVSGDDPSGQPVGASDRVDVTVIPQAAEAAGLANTGSESTLPFAAFGVLLLLVGTLIVVRRRVAAI
ncbi:DUF7507 domain-containing protein [Microbacterium sp. SA39]|uniref:DUF7507 domain-containing protein n=1 Tax=Microbacterium sp. SA39 TaxID=1263625 RepID=UPI0005F9B763|nr:GEVED domain-containing protein [Microbacterium sp. SA39]KJQ52797.1 hypothetical protein RS85_03691 [Microbacterium sp. SA39]